MIALADGKVILDGAPEEVLACPLLLQAGISWLRYTHAAQIGSGRGLWPVGRPLPVTLEQAAVGFEQTGVSRPLLEQEDADPS